MLYYNIIFKYIHNDLCPIFFTQNMLWFCHFCVICRLALLRGSTSSQRSYLSGKFPGGPVAVVPAHLCLVLVINTFRITLYIQGPVLRVLHGGAGGAVWPEPQGVSGRREQDRAPDAVPARAAPDTRRGGAAPQSWYVLSVPSSNWDCCSYIRLILSGVCT